jgi:hypothetical protein
MKKFLFLSIVACGFLAATSIGKLKQSHYTAATAGIAQNIVGDTTHKKHKHKKDSTEIGATGMAFANANLTAAGK